MPCGQMARADRGEGTTKLQIEKTHADNIAFIASQPHRRGLGNKSEIPKAGYAHGRLLLTGQISEKQFQAAEAYMLRAIAYKAVVAGSLPRLPSLSAELASRGVGSAADMPPERIAAIRSDYSELQDALAERKLKVDGNEALTALTIMDRDPCNSNQMGIIRSSLNLIAQRLRL